MTFTLNTSAERLEDMISEAPAQAAAGQGVMIDPLLLASMARELQRLRSPVTVSDEMVEWAARAMCRVQMDRNEKATGKQRDADFRRKAEDYGWRQFEPEARAALTAALVPAEQEGERRHTFTVPDGFEAVRDSEGRATGEVRPTPGGDNRVVAWCPDVCPLTHRPFFMWIDGEPTYGGPFDSYTIPTRDAEGEYSCRRYDHDEGGWKDWSEGLSIKVVDESDWLGLEGRAETAEASLAAALPLYAAPLPQVDEGMVERACKTTDPLLFSGDPQTEHMAASPYKVEHVQNFVRAKLRAALLAALTPQPGGE